jgi:hypothetical protein
MLAFSEAFFFLFSSPHDQRLHLPKKRMLSSPLTWIYLLRAFALSWRQTFPWCWRIGISSLQLTVVGRQVSSCGFVSVVILRKKCAPSKISLYFYIRDRTQPAARPSILPVTPQRTDVDLKLFNRTFPDHIITMVSARGRNDHGDMMQCLYQ